MTCTEVAGADGAGQLYGVPICFPVWRQGPVAPVSTYRIGGGKPLDTLWMCLATAPAAQRGGSSARVRRSQARAMRRSRSTVASETACAQAISSCVMPPK
jgi:hypothetical protein